MERSFYRRRSRGAADSMFPADQQCQRRRGFMQAARLHIQLRSSAGALLGSRPIQLRRLPQPDDSPIDIFDAAVLLLGRLGNRAL
jgi:hypothetical protein